MRGVSTSRSSTKGKSRGKGQCADRPDLLADSSSGEFGDRSPRTSSQAVDSDVVSSEERDQAPLFPLPVTTTVPMEMSESPFDTPITSAPPGTSRHTSPLQKRGRLAPPWARIPI